MRPLERVPAVRRIETDRHDTFAVDLAGEFTSADAENLFGLLEGAYALSPQLDLLVRTAQLDAVDLSDFDGGTREALRAHLDEHVGKFAIVDDGEWADAVERLLRPGPEVEVSRFLLDGEVEAWRWIGARPVVENT